MIARQGRHYLLTSFDELIRLSENGLPNLVELSEKAGDLIAPKHAVLRTDRSREVELEAWSRILERGVHVSPVDRLEGATDDLHVLLRHRLGSISRRVQRLVATFLDR